MKKQLRRMTAGIAAAAMLLAPVSTEGTFPSGDASPAELTAQAGDFDYLFAPITGTCGEDVTYSFDMSSGVLTISGSGKMDKGPRDAYYEASWYTSDMASSVKEVVIEEGITNIPDNAFAGHNNLTKITIPDTVTSIGKNAFGNGWVGDLVFSGDMLVGGTTCSSLTSIEIPDSVTSIDERAFYGCTALEKITFPKNLQSIGKEAFLYCMKLPSADISGVTEIPESAFEECRSLETIKLSGKLETISEAAFRNCQKLDGVTLPDTLTGIGKSAFASCTSLSEIHIPESVTELGDMAFGNCTNLQAANIPSAFTSVPYGLFVGDERLDNVKLPEGTTSIGGYAFWKNGMTKLVLPDSVTSVGEFAYAKCEKLTDVTIPETLTDFGCNSFTGSAWHLSVYEEEPLIVNGVLLSLKHHNSVPTYIPDGVQAIAGGSADMVTVFEITKTKAGKLKQKIVIPESVTRIDEHAFWSEELEKDAASVLQYQDGITIYGKPGSYAETWAGEHNLKFKDVAELPADSAAEPAETTAPVIETELLVTSTTVTGPVYTKPATSTTFRPASTTTAAATTVTTTVKPADSADAVLGDVNGDAAIDILDVIALNKFLLGSETFSDAQKTAADVDGNSVIDSTDSLNILKYVVELISSFDSVPVPQDTTESAPPETTEPASQETAPSPAANRKLTDAEVQFKPSANASVEWETYSDEDVTLQYPKGWEVKCSTQDLQLCYEVTDPKTGICWTYSDLVITFYADQTSVDNCKTLLPDFKLYEVLPEGSAQAFYELLYGPAFNQNVASSTVTSSEALGKSPLKQVLESTGSGDLLNEVDYSAVTMDVTLAGDAGKEMELLGVAGASYNKLAPLTGLTAEPLDLSTYFIYGARCYLAPKGELSNWTPVLDKSITSLKTTEAYEKKVAQRIKEQSDALAKASLSKSTVSTSDTADMMYDSWKKRQESQDCQAQKWSDYTLGYDRVYDTQTGDTYRASYGFMDNYDGSRYRAATGSEYLQPVQGTFDFSIDGSGNITFTDP